MFKFFFHALLGLTALFIYSWISLFFLPPEARDARWSYKMNTGAVTLLFCTVSGLIWYLQREEHQMMASLLLYGFYGVLLLFILWTIMHGRWN